MIIQGSLDFNFGGKILENKILSSENTREEYYLQIRVFFIKMELITIF